MRLAGCLNSESVRAPDSEITQQSGTQSLRGQAALVEVHGEGAEVGDGVDGGEVGVVLVGDVAAGAGENDEVGVVDDGAGVLEAAVDANE